MASDTFICGTCQSIFHDIHLFVQHKSDVTCVVESSSCIATDQSQPVTSLLRLTSDDTNGASPTYFIIQDGSLLDDAAILLQPQSVGFSSTAVQTTVVLKEKVEKGTHRNVPNASREEVLEIVPLPASSEDDVMGGHGIDLQLFMRPASSLSTTGCRDAGFADPTPVRKRGRPRKGEEKNPKISPSEMVRPEEPALPRKDADGKYHCTQCQKSFMRDRHFRTHRCLAVIGYVDITQKEALDDGDAEAEAQEDGNNWDGSVSATVGVRSRTTKAQKQTTDPIKKTILGSNNKFSSTNTITTPSPTLEESSTTPNKLEPDNIQPESDSNASEPLAVQRLRSSSSPKIDSPDTRGRQMPVFQDENDRLAFDRSLQVDLGALVDHMFKLHVIDQNTNERAVPTHGRTQATLNVYSCDTCRKVFMSLSHVRLHCLIHTDIRPFKCFKCRYVTNTRGNLYTHMRTHTGMVYRCTSCDFTTVNRGHLTEHEQTHSDVRHKCDLCQRDYNTVKSLVNHVRKYHKTSEGAKYLSQFQKKQTSNSVLMHQCQVCNRKFKKRNDLERHVFMHDDLAPTSKSFTCDVCGHVTGRRNYLEKHLRRHRIVYVCCLCLRKFPSSSRLRGHLEEVHGNDEGFDVEGFFQRSVECSLFLPEPDGSMDGWLNPDASFGEELGEFVEEMGESDGCGESAKEVGSVEGIRVGSAQSVEVGLGDEVRSVSEVGNAGEMAVVKFSDCVTLDAGDSISGGSSGMAVEFEAKGIQVKGNPDGLAGGLVRDPQTTPDPGVPDAAGEHGSDHLEKVGLRNHSMEAENDNGNSSITKAPDEIFRQHENQLDGKGKLGEKKSVVEDESDILAQLGFLPMNLTIFENIRNTFGSEECEFCGRLFVTKSDSRLHRRIHTGEKPFICDQCPYCAATKESLQSHIEKVHERAVFTCMKCDWSGASRSSLWLHNQKRHKLQPEYLCTKCKKVFSNVKKLRIHFQLKHPEITKTQLNDIISSFRRKHGKLGRRLHRCPYCNKAFPSSSRSLQKHLWIHEGLKPFKCHVCAYACRSRSNLTAHMLRHSAEKPFLCTKCGKPYKSRTALRWHIRSHKPGHAFACTKCPYTAVQPSHLKRHLETHDVIKRFPCKLCAFSANTETYLKIHYARTHDGEVIPVDDLTMTPVDRRLTSGDDGLQALQCVNCDFRFGNVSDMRRHLRLKHQIELHSTKELDTLVTGVSSQGQSEEGGGGEQAGTDLRFSTPEGVYVAGDNLEEVFETTSTEYFTCAVETSVDEGVEEEEAVTSEEPLPVGHQTTNQLLVSEEGENSKPQVLYTDQNGDYFYINIQDQLVYISDANATHVETTLANPTHVVAFDAAGTTHAAATHVEPAHVEAGTVHDGAVPRGDSYRTV